jgi:flagellar basal body-associated protein FliL
MQPNTNPTPDPVIAPEEFTLPEEAMRVSHGGGEAATLPIILGVIIVILVLILGGLYLWGSTLGPAPVTVDESARPTAEENNEPESNTADAQVQALETVSTSNELDAIEADLEATNLDAIDMEIGTIDGELGSGE